MRSDQFLRSCLERVPLADTQFSSLQDHSRAESVKQYLRALHAHPPEDMFITDSEGLGSIVNLDLCGR